MLKNLIFLSLIVLTSGCTIFSLEQKNYKQELGKIPKKEGMSFANKEALSAGATLGNRTAAKVFYQGTKPASREAEILYDMSYRFLDLAGVNDDFDLSDDASIEEVFEKADRALAQKDQAIHKLETDVAEFRNDLIAHKRIIRDREVEMQSLTDRFKAKLNKLWTWLLGILIGIIVLVVGLGIAQTMTGIPFLSIFFGGTRLVVGAARQTIRGIQAVRNELKHEMQNGGTAEEKAAAEATLLKIDTKLENHQDPKVQKWIEDQKQNHL